MVSSVTFAINNYFMEHLEAWALDTATFKPMDNTFFIRPHSPQVFNNFLRHTRVDNVHPTTQFKTKREKECHLPFLGIDIYR
jgi:hypothetical protein